MIENKTAESLCFIEAGPGDLQGMKGPFIALTPEMVHVLSRQGIDFFIPDDFLPLRQLYSLEGAYADLFERWIDGLDKDLIEGSDIFKSLNIKPAFLYGYFLREMIDGFVVKALEIKAIFEKLKPKSVVFFHCDQKQTPVDYQLTVKGCSIESLVIPLLCIKYDVSYRELAFDSPQRSRVDYKGVLRPIKTLVERLFYSCVYGRLFSKAPSVMVINRHWGIKEIERSMFRKGYRSSSVYPGYRWQKSKTFPLPHRPVIEGRVFDDFVGIKISSLFQERLDFFAGELCGNLAAAIKYYKDIFKKDNVRLLIGAGKYQFDEFAIMATATAMDGLLAVQIDHGYAAFGARFWRFTENPCNLLLTTDEEIKNYMANTIVQGFPTAVEVATTWTGQYRAVDASKTLKARDEKTVLYLPTAIEVPYHRLDGFSYANTWYVKHQMQLLEYFSKQQDYHFICKTVSGWKKTTALLAKIVQERGWTNIKVQVGALSDYLSWAGRVIIDFPSTPLYEAVLSGVPTLCLYYEGLQIRDSARALFGEVLQPFSSTAQAIDKAQKFLYGRKENYLGHLPDSDYKDPGPIVLRALERRGA